MSQMSLPEVARNPADPTPTVENTAYPSPQSSGYKPAEIVERGNHPGEVVVDRGCSRYGLERIHVMRMGEAVDMESWVEWLELEASIQSKTVEWESSVIYDEVGLGVHHLRLYWRLK